MSELYYFLYDFIEELKPFVYSIKLILVEFRMKFGSYHSYYINFKPYEYRKCFMFGESG